MWSESIDTQNLSVEKLEVESGESPPFPKYHNMGHGQPNRPLQISRINSRKCEKLTSTGFSGARERNKKTCHLKRLKRLSSSRHLFSF